ncbi:MAG: hypothetical protein EOO01_44445 [Chitinophagaceae bacterium]|nr:MAG: hypothetical protein EOO01_44445 [Chitinophagaceae bacterium]
MRKSEWYRVLGIFTLYLAVFLGIDIFFQAIGAFDERPWWMILTKNLVIAIALTVFLNWKLIRGLFKNKNGGHSNI